MDRNSIIGLVLIGLILIGYSIYYRPSEEEVQKAQRIRDSIAQAEQARQLEQRLKDSLEQNQPREVNSEMPEETTASTARDTVAVNQQLKSRFGNLYTAAKGKEQRYVIENDLIKITLNNQGGKPYLVELKEFDRYDDSPVVLFNGVDTEFGFGFYSENRVINTNDLYFVPQGDSMVDASTAPNELKLRMNAANGQYIQYTYRLEPGSYMVDFDVTLHRMNELVAANTNFLDLTWKTDIVAQERGRKWESQNSTVYYKFFEDDVEHLSKRSDDDSERLTTRLKWVGFKQQFFSSVLIADDYMLDGTVSYEAYEETSDKIMNCEANLTVPFKSQPESTVPMSFYFGPNHYKTLKSFDLALEEVVPLGWAIFGWVNRFIIIPLFNFLGGFINSYGIIILIMTIIIKIVLFPLTYRSYLSTAKMRVVKPQVDAINEKYPKREDAMKKQQETMALYKKAGISPAGGCLPLLLQMPILIAMYRFFPASIELRQEQFLWANDLSSYDSILDLPFTIPFYGDHVSLFTLLMAATLLITTHMNSSQMSGSSQQMPGMKTMMYFMPVMLLFIFNGYSSGLSYYLFISNLITIGQTFAMRNFVDHDKLLKKMEANKKKPVKKSNFQQKLEKMAKEQQKAKGSSKKR